MLNKQHDKHFGSGVSLIGGQVCCTILAILGTVFIPRRPHVYFDGSHVDGMRTETLFSRYSFHWATKILKLAAKKGHFDEEDLPVLDRARRAERLEEEFRAFMASSKLHWQIFRAHWRSFVKSYLATLIGTIATFTSPLILNQILKQLEKRDLGDANAAGQARFWVAALGLVKGFETVVLSYQYWYGNSPC